MSILHLARTVRQNPSTNLPIKIQSLLPHPPDPLPPRLPPNLQLLQRRAPGLGRAPAPSPPPAPLPRADHRALYAAGPSGEAPRLGSAAEGRHALRE